MNTPQTSIYIRKDLTILVVSGDTQIELPLGPLDAMRIAHELMAVTIDETMRRKAGVRIPQGNDDDAIPNAH